MTEENPPKYIFAKQLTLLFIGLKLTDHIDWSWAWVVSPVFIAHLLNVAVGPLEKKIIEWEARLQARTEAE